MSAEICLSSDSGADERYSSSVLMTNVNGVVSDGDWCVGAPGVQQIKKHVKATAAPLNPLAA